MGELERIALGRIESAARDVLTACGRMRGNGEDAAILLEAARDAYMDALELSNAEIVRDALKGAAA